MYCVEVRYETPEIIFSFAIRSWTTHKKKVVDLLVSADCKKLKIWTHCKFNKEVGMLLVGIEVGNKIILGW